MAVTHFTDADIEAYFQSKRAGLDAQLVSHVVAFINATEKTLDCAIYDLRHPQVLEALAQLAARPGVKLRIAFDASGERNGGVSADPKPSGTHAAIAQAGLMSHATPVHEHGRHLMHNKFFVRDGRAVWVGSANMTAGGLELQDNNCLAITSSALASIYTGAFEELISPNHHHSATPRTASGARTAAPASVSVGGAQITPYFAPAAGEGIEQTLVDALSHARRIRIFAFLLGDPGILDALAPLAQNHSVDIRGIYDPHGMQDVLRAKTNAAHSGRTGKGAHAAPDDARFWFMHDRRFIAAPSHGFATGREQDFMHNKVMVIDDHTVFTGSYNFSENAEENDETFLAIESPALARAYTDYFDALEAAYAGAGVRQPVAVGATHGAAALGAATVGAAAATRQAPSEDVVAGLRRDHSRNVEHAPTPKPRRRKAQRAASSAPRRGERSWLGGAIALTALLFALTALALIAFVALTLSGVTFPF